MFIELEEDESSAENDGVLETVVAEFDNEESQINEGIEKFCNNDQTVQIKRNSCLSHNIQLVMGIFDSFRNAKGSPPLFSKSIKKARRLVAKFNNSARATTRLIELCGKKLVGDVVMLNNSIAYQT